jgi:hypothetical protein
MHSTCESGSRPASAPASRSSSHERRIATRRARSTVSIATPERAMLAAVVAETANSFSFGSRRSEIASIARPRSALTSSAITSGGSSERPSTSDRIDATISFAKRSPSRRSTSSLNSAATALCSDSQPRAANLRERMYSVSCRLGVASSL